jgi:hypothetical protein
MWLVGWYLAAGETNYNRQIGSANLAVAGLLLAGAGHVWCIMKGRRAIGERRRQLIGEPAPVPPESLVGGSVSLRAEGPTSRSPATVAGKGMRRYHRIECPLAAGRDWPVLPVEEQEAVGRLPCGVCRP